jgi:hypothetical protein
MNPTTSPLQVLLGVVLGALLQPAAIFLASRFWTVLLNHKSSWPEMDLIFHIVLFFGIVQAFAILPAALVFYAARKHGVVSGLLYFGTFLALLNVLAWITNYRNFFHPPIY